MLSHAEPLSHTTHTTQAECLLDLLRMLADSNYQFTTTTPRTHQHVVALRAVQGSANLRDIFGWNLPFAENIISPAMLALMHEAEILRAHDKGGQSSVRVATLGNHQFLHSAYPTTDPAAVFLARILIALSALCARLCRT